MIWVFSPGQAIHIGASGLIFTMAGFLLFAGLFSTAFWQIVAGIVTLFLYGLPFSWIIADHPGHLLLWPLVWAALRAHAGGYSHPFKRRIALFSPLPQKHSHRSAYR